MELVKMSNVDRLKLCKRYFFIGCFFLPLVWLINCCWFGLFLYKFEEYSKQQIQARRRKARARFNTRPKTSESNPQLNQRLQSLTQPHDVSPTSEEEPFEIDDETKKHLKDVRRYVILSFIGLAIWMTIIIAWQIVFHSNRVAWGEFADRISFNIPRGIP